MDCPNVDFTIDLGGEEADILAVAQADQIDIFSGVISPDEVREKRLGLATDAREKTPRFIMGRTGAFPLKAIMEIGGDIDPETGAPIPGSVEQITGIAGTEQIDPAELLPQKDPTEPATPTPSAGPVIVGKSVDELVATWRKSSLTRVKAGRAPKLFTDLPTDIAAPIWAQLHKATTPAEVADAFPKAPGPSGFEQLIIDMATQVTPHLHRILRDVTGIHPAITTATARHNVTKAHGPTDAVAAMAAQQMTVNYDNLPSLLTDMYTAAYLEAAKQAAARAGGHPPAWIARISTVNWDTWTPGDRRAAYKIAQGGLAQLLSQQGAVINGITHTTYTQLGNTLADALTQGLGVGKTAGMIADLLDNPSRADTIANTEIARAVSAASLDTYTLNAITQVDWIAEGDACPTCASYADESPWPLDNVPDLPDHPNCRCSYAPVVDAPTDLGGFDG